MTTERKSYSSNKFQLELPYLIEVQKASYEQFLQKEISPEKRLKVGLERVFQDIFPITDVKGLYSLNYEGYYFGIPKYSIPECRERGLTYSMELYATLSLQIFEEDGEDRKLKEEVKNDVLICELPIMTENGTFIVNGAERVVVSQLHRSYGISFDEELQPSGRSDYKSRIIPHRGAWVEFNTEGDTLYLIIDRKKKLAATTMLRCIGFETTQEILKLFYKKSEEVSVSDLSKEFDENGVCVLIDRIIFEDVIDKDSGEVIVHANDVIDEKKLECLIENKVETVVLLSKDEDNLLIHYTLAADKSKSREDALKAIYSVTHQQQDEAPDMRTAELYFDSQFISDPHKYDLGEVGRYRLNAKIYSKPEILKVLEEQGDEFKIPSLTTMTMSKADFLAIIEYMVGLYSDTEGYTLDDIDHLGNRRTRSVGELLANQISVGLSRMSRVIRENLNLHGEDEQTTPRDLVNTRMVSSTVQSFFGSSQLSQFMDQMNPLSELTHKRRLSALGPGGLSRERAGFEVRDVHYTHYGRLCPIESPEGPNIGLISSLCVYARIDALGFIETPYRDVKDGKVDLTAAGCHYMSAEEEENKLVSLANVRMDNDGNILEDRIQCRLEADFPVVTKEEVNYMDVAPNQMASVAASLIPFLEHDDAHRALMGANMMRQAVPLLKPESPIVGTGLEERVCLDSRTQFIAERKGEVTYVDANEIRIRYEQTDDEKFVSFSPEETVYKLPIYRRTNQSTTICLSPIVSKGDKVEKGQVLTQGYASQNGELALGRNLMVAFMPWKGYNYEDAIVLSEEMVKWDVLTSIHVDEYLTEVRDTKRGMEELTSDIPNVSEDATKNLGEDGIVRIGAHIEPGDIMIGKITPKGESDPSPEEKLLKAIFGDKAGDVKDASLKANPSLSGTVVGTALYAKLSKETGKKSQAKNDQKTRLEMRQAEFDRKAEKLYADFIQKLVILTKNRKSAGISDLYGVEIIPKDKKITTEMLKSIDYTNITSAKWTTDKDANLLIRDLINNYCIALKTEQAICKREMDKIKVGDELPNGVMQLAKVYIAKKRKITVGDKMAGRHGNKGIVAKIVRQEDMPFLEDGTPVDIVLNPLGVPSRMNLGQIYETVLGWAGARLGLKFSTPIFDGASIDEICAYTDKAGVPRFGKTRLRDGGTGDYFDQPATVGVIYMIKLGHMVDDKMHARSIGPYSLITQQPLGGKAQFGGQRFGEMEVWALEAFGAANALQEILTVKSDDVVGRSKTYEAIVKGDPMPPAGIPESLNVLLHELRGLGLKVTLD